MLKAPLPWLRPYPEARETLPPTLVVEVLSPAATTMRPPAAQTPRPTATLTLPAVPDVAAPVRSITAPEPPLDVVPVANANIPLTPLVPADTARTLKTPLDAALP